MSKNVIQEALNKLKKDWVHFENILYSPSKQIEFQNFLKNYRGMPSEKSIIAQKNFGKKLSSDLLNFLYSIIENDLVYYSFCMQEVENYFLNVEKNINLILYYWCGLNDRNYQFRTIVHFCEIFGDRRLLFRKFEKEYYLNIHENGFIIGYNIDLDAEPNFLPVSKVCDLRQNLSLRNLFARLRTVQREVCRLIDEWEHLNAILAVDYGKTYQAYQAFPSKETEEQYLFIQKKMDKRRNSLANWVLESLCEFQEWISEISLINHHEDIIDELDALAALLLASVQKIFLPASISRLKYQKDIPPLFARFARSRLNYCEDDFSSYLMLQASESAFGSDFLSTLLTVIKMKPYEWKYCFDASIAVKSFPWCYSKEHHLLLCIILAISYFKKYAPNVVDLFVLNDILACLQAPENFHESIVHLNPLSISSEDIWECRSILLNYLDNNVKDNEETKQCVNSIKKYLSM